MDTATASNTDAIATPHPSTSSLAPVAIELSTELRSANRYWACIDLIGPAAAAQIRKAVWESERSGNLLPLAEVLSATASNLLEPAHADRVEELTNGVVDRFEMFCEHNQPSTPQVICDLVAACQAVNRG